MKIAIFAPSFPPLANGGVSSSHYNLYLALKDRFDVRVFTYDEVACCSHEEHDVFRYGLPCWVTRLIRLAITVLLRICGAKGTVYQCSDAICGALAGLKIFHYVRDFDPDILIIPDHGPVSVFWPRLNKGKTIFVSHHNSMRFHDKPALGLHSRLDALLGRWFEQRAVNKTDVVVCPSHYMRGIFRETYAFPGSIEVIPNLIDSAVSESTLPASLHELLLLPVGAPIVYIPSAGSIYKGRNCVFEIIRRLSKEYAREIGFYLSGTLDAEFTDFFAGLPDTVKVYAPGPVSYHANISNMKACKICITPSLLESFGMAVLEAQWNGIPVVAFDTGGIREIIIDGLTGFICPYLDLDSLVRHSLALLSSDELASTTERQATEFIRTRFNEKMIADRYSELFHRITGFH